MHDIPETEVAATVEDIKAAIENAQAARRWRPSRTMAKPLRRTVERSAAAALAEQLRMPRMQQQNERQRLHIHNLPGLHSRPKLIKR